MQRSSFFRYAKTLKAVAIQALDAGMISTGWAWLGPSDVFRAEDAKVPGKQRIGDAKRALSGWLYFGDNRTFEKGFVEQVKARAIADFGVKGDFGQLDAPFYSLNLYDVRMHACMSALILATYNHCTRL